MIERLRTRLPEEKDESLLSELLTTVTDRLCLRLGAEELPSAFGSVAVDAAVKMYRRIYYEGMSGENVVSISNSFVDDILAEYDEEIGGWKTARANGGNSDKAVRFL